jgi:predicted dehydrogenase
MAARLVRRARRELRVAVVGTGPWGINHVRTFSQLPGSRVRYIVDIDERNLTRAGRLCPDSVALSDYRRVLDRVDYEAAIIATPAETHYPIARAFLAAGKHVLVEKPMALLPRHARELCAVARQSGVKLMVGHILLYHPALRYLKDYLDRSEFGPVTGISSERLDRLPVRARTEDALWGFVPHDVSMMLFLLGQMPVTVRATGRRMAAGTNSGDCPPAPPLAAVSFELGFANHVTASGRAGWMAKTKVRRLTVSGNGQTAVFDDTEPKQKLRFCPSAANISLPAFDLRPPLDLECEHFLNCVRRNEKPLTDGKNGLAVVSVLAALEESIRRRGTQVRIGG